MRLEVTAWGQKFKRELDVPLLKLGGSQRDDVFVEGLDPSQVRVRKTKGQIWITSPKPSRLNGVEMAPHAAFRVLPGERVSWDDGALALALGQTHVTHIPHTRMEPASLYDAATVALPLVSDSTHAVETRVVRPWGILTCINGPHAGRVLTLTLGEIEIGRGADVQLQLGDPTVSKRQARICWDGQLAQLECLSRTNVTLLNGAPFRGAGPLDPGAVLTFGNQLLRFELAHASVGMAARVNTGARTHLRRPLALRNAARPRLGFWGWLRAIFRGL
ncbi:MAG: FHA domain-containing protein [Myxococcaceae bacterium]|nr:FHA domain-containing protein [Myxococcaceae bacterium]